MAKHERIMFLLGAGISLKAGMPSTAEITRRVLCATDIEWVAEGNYRFADGSHSLASPQSPIPHVLEFLDHIRRLIELFRGERTCQANYEDLFYVVDQVADATVEYDNPALAPLLDELSTAYPDHAVAPPEGGPEHWGYQRLADEARSYILFVVAEMLRKEPDVSYLGAVTEACTDDSFRTDVVTLNHDRVVETALNRASIRYVDGFSDNANHLRPWQPERFHDLAAGVRLLKLHGSVDWWTLAPRNGGRRERIVAAVEGGADLVVDGQRYDAVPPPGRPLLLVGTHNKVREYSSLIFVELYYRFIKALHEARPVIVSGYSFGDKGVNRLLADWIETHTSPRMVIVHQEPERLLAAARPAIREKWQGWVADGRLQLIRKWIEDTTWSELKAPGDQETRNEER